MKILSIETSCDDTGIAVLEEKNGGFSVLANVIASQIKTGKKYGGVFPMAAKREHQRNLLPVFTKALKESKLLKISNSQFPISKTETLNKILEREPELAKKLIPFLEKYKKPDIDFIAVTNGPGLEPCLWVGVNFAKALSYFWDIPIVPVNHIEGHILVNFLSSHVIPAKAVIQFPAIALVVSGGHTQIVLAEKIGKYKILGETRDDAAGECFDKCAKILGLGYPGGPIIAELAKKSKPGIITLPRPMINSKDYDFSFSGLKTAVLYADRKIKTKNKKYKIEMATEIQQAIIDVLIKKTMKAVKDYGAKTLILGGGVSANQELRNQLKLHMSDICKLVVPEPALSTDNGLMIAIAGYFNRAKKIGWQKLQADGNLRVDSPTRSA
jgi:N6-L-threonylcarbamoyladenine synthase